jgi:RNA polymerase sigma-70 factor (ECF subfamily)
VSPIEAGARKPKKPIDLNARSGPPPEPAAPRDPQQDEAAWVRQALAGQIEGFNRLYAAHARRVKVYFLRSGFGQAEADDLTQDTFIRVHKSLSTFNPQRGRFGVWVSAIAKNVARRKWSARKQAAPLDPEMAEEILSGGDNPRAAAAAQEEIDAVRDCIRLLDEELQQIIRLRYVQGLTTRGMGRQLEMPEATVRLRLKEACGHVQRCLQTKGLLQ